MSGLLTILIGKFLENLGFLNQIRRTGFARPRKTGRRLLAGSHLFILLSNNSKS